MAIVNILAKKTTQIPWEDFLRTYAKLGVETPEIELFPIPKGIGFHQDAIGVSVQKGFRDKHKLVTEIRSIILLLNKFDMELFELYDGNKICLRNFDVIEKLLI